MNTFLFQTLLGSLERDNLQFKETIKTKEASEEFVTWAGSSTVRKHILALSLVILPHLSLEEFTNENFVKDQRNFREVPPIGIEDKLKDVEAMAKHLLTIDPNLEKIRYELVPKV